MKFSIHTNKCGVTATFPATRNTNFFQVCLCFWNWKRDFRGPVLMLLTHNNVEYLSLAGYGHVTYGN